MNKRNEERLNYIKDKKLQMHALSNFDINFLIEQAERVQELEEDLRLSEQEEKRRWKENKRYREAIEKVTEKTSYKYRDGNMSYIHNILTEALGG